MKYVKYCLFCALLFVSSSVFARSTYIYNMPGGDYMIYDFHSPATYVYNMPGGDYMVTDFRHKPAFISKIPGGYMYDTNEMRSYDYVPINSILGSRDASYHVGNRYDYNNYDCDSDYDY